MNDWTVERLDALPAFTLIGGIEPAGYPERSLMIFWFKDEDGLFHWIGYPSFSDSDEALETPGRNGTLRVGARSVSSTAAAIGCPNPNWQPVIREGTLELVEFTYSILFDGFEEPNFAVFIHAE